MRKLMWFTLGFGSCCLLCSFPGKYCMLFAAAICLMALPALYLLGRENRALHCMAHVLMGAAAGILWFCLFDYLFLASPAKMESMTESAVITVSDYSEEGTYGSAVDGFVTIDGKEYRVHVYLSDRRELAPGDKLKGNFFFRTTLREGSGKSSFYAGQKIYLLVYSRGKIEVNRPESVPFRFQPAVWRHHMGSTLDAILSEKTAGFAKALLLGDRSGIDYQTKTIFKVSGISHVIAVSGLHVSILFSMIYLLTAHRRFLSSLIGFPVLVLFAAIVGFTPSVTRACIMQCLILLGLMLDREYDPATALSFAVLIILTANPMTALSVSFQLSVSCVAGILLFYTKIYTWLTDAKQFGPAKGKTFSARVKRWIFGSAAVTVSTNIMTVPLVAYYFGTVSIVGILTNILVLWAVTFAFYSVMDCLILSFFSMKLASILAIVPKILICYILEISAFLARIPMAAVYTASIYVIVWLIGAYLLLAVFLLLRKNPETLICCVVMTLLLAQGFSWLEPLSAECQITALNVGQGQSVLIQCAGKAYLVDCGGDTPEKAADIAAETLLSQGISRLDGMIITHYDADHVDGVLPLLDRIDADMVLVPEIADQRGCVNKLLPAAEDRIYSVNQSLRFEFDGCVMTVFGPDSYNEGNESSLCVLLQTKNCDILITGDRGSLGESRLIQDTNLPDLELLVAGHHGSATSTSREFLSATAPDVVFISAGRNNRFGHPAEEVLKRLSEFGCEVYRTDLHGSITFRR